MYVSFFFVFLLTNFLLLGSNYDEEHPRQCRWATMTQRTPPLPQTQVGGLFLHHGPLTMTIHNDDMQQQQHESCMVFLLVGFQFNQFYLS